MGEALEGKGKAESDKLAKSLSCQMACVGETGRRSPVANASSYATHYELIDSQNQNGICKKTKAQKENSLVSNYPALG